MSIKLDEVTHKYNLLIERSLLLHEITTELGSVESYYSYSLDSFIDIILTALDNTEFPEEKYNPSDTDLDTLWEVFTYEVYKIVTPGLFKKHKLLFSTLLCLKMAVDEGSITQEEMDVFMAKPLPLVLSSKPKHLTFISDESYHELARLQKLEVFSDLWESIEDNAFYWKEWMEQTDLSASELPSPYNTKVSPHH
jgi:dynein heavy chain